MFYYMFFTAIIPEEYQEVIKSCNGMLFKNYYHNNTYYSCVWQNYKKNIWYLGNVLSLDPDIFDLNTIIRIHNK